MTLHPRVLVPLLFSLCLAPAAFAQVDRQDNELAANASLVQPLSHGDPTLTLGAHYGKLLKDVHLLGGTLQVGGDALFTGALDFSGLAILTLFPQARLYFQPKDPRFSPYVGVGLGLTIFHVSDTTVNVAYDVNGGVKIFVNPTTAAFVQLDLEGPLTDPGSSLIIASAGLSIFF